MGEKSEEYNNRRIAFNTPSFKKMMWEKKGNKCISCGGEANELHHIVPLMAGGTNAESNIVPLCDGCHGAIHLGVDIRRCKNRNKGGRKKVTGVDGYFTCEELAKKLGVTRRLIQDNIKRKRLYAIRVKGADYIPNWAVEEWNNNKGKRAIISIGYQYSEMSVLQKAELESAQRRACGRI